jgi:hypothetical protein
LTRFDGAIVDLMLPNDAQASGITIEESRGGFQTGLAIARRFLHKKPDIRIAILLSGVGNAEAQAWASQKSIPFVLKQDGYDSLTALAGQTESVSERRMCNCISDLLSITYLKQQIL